MRQFSGCGQAADPARMEHGKEILKTGTVPRVFLALHILIAAIAGVSALCLLWAFGWHSGYNGTLVIRSLYLVFAVLCGVILFAILYKLCRYKGNWTIVAYEDRISGIAIGPLLKRFDLPYGDIVGISCRKRTLTLQTKNQNYICVVSDARDFYYLILERRKFRVIIE